MMRHAKLGLLVCLLSVANAFSQDRDQAKPNQFQLVNEAAKNRYTLRRIEFTGNEHIRDYVLRQRTRMLREGDIFKKAALRQTLKSLNQLRIKPVNLKDIEVHLDRAEKLVDISIPITERRRRI